MEEKKQIEAMAEIMRNCSMLAGIDIYEQYARHLYEKGCRISIPLDPRKIVDIGEYYNEDGVNVLRTIYSDGSIVDQLRPNLPRAEDADRFMEWMNDPDRM